jgi:hypothetical protein
MSISQITGTYTAGIALTSANYTNPVTVTSTGKVSGASYGLSAATAWTVANHGSVGSTGATGKGIDFSAGGSVGNYATISGYIGVDIGGGTGAVTNSGSILGGFSGIVEAFGGTVTNAAGGTISGNNGVMLEGQPGTVDNQGSIAGTFGNGIYLGEGGSVLNSGSISGHADGVYFRVAGAILTNAAGAYIGGFQAIVAGAGTGGGPTAIDNFGVVQGDTQAATSATAAAGAGVYLDAGGSVTNETGGYIAAYRGIVVTGAAGTVVNSGTISAIGGSLTGKQAGLNAGVALMHGGQITNNAGGVISGPVLGIHGGAQSITVDNAGTITGDTGVGLNAGLITNAAGGTISGSDFGIFANNYLTVANSGTISGGANTGIIAYGGSVLNAASGSISGGIGINFYFAASTVTNYGSISAVGAHPFDGVDLAGGGLLNNHAGASISGHRHGVSIGSSNATVENAGYIGGTNNYGVAFAAGGMVTNAAGGTITGYGGVNGINNLTVLNAGLISAPGADGIDAESYTYVSNAASGTITGTYEGIDTGGHLTVFNAGLISGTGTNGEGVSVGSDVHVSNAASGTIAGYETGIWAGYSTTIINAGAVNATGTAGVGIEMRGGEIVNHGSGTISSVHGNGVDLLSAASTVENAGTISGATDAVHFFFAGANRLIVDPGAVFNGNVEANTGGTNVLEVTAISKGAAAALSGLGSQFTGFQTLLFDVGASWTVAGSFTGTTTIAGFHPFDVLDLTSIAYSAGDTVQLTGGNVLEILNSSNTVLWSAQLENQSFGTPDYSGYTFSIAKDGSGGTDVTVLPDNEPPVIAVPGGQTDTAKFPIAISGVSITDADNGYSHETFTVTVSDSTGLLSAQVRGGGTVSGAGTNTLTLTGSLVQVNAELTTLTYTGTALGGDTISVAVDDGRGGTDNKTIGVTVNPATVSWVGSSLAAWGNASNWSGGEVPNDALTNAVIALGASSLYKIKIYSGQSFTVNQLTIDDPKASFILAGSLTAGAGVTDSAGGIAMQGGTLTGALSLATGASLLGAGTITGAVANAGLVEARGGLLDIAGTVTGSGTLQVDLTSTLDLGGDAASQTIAFDNGAPGNAALARPILVLDQPGGSFGTITGFALGDTIDLKNTASTSDNYSGGVLTVFNGSATVATLTIAGSFSGDTFALGDDGHGGTDITLVTVAAGVHSGPIRASRQAAQLVQAIAAHGDRSSLGDLVALDRAWNGTAAGALAASAQH